MQIKVTSVSPSVQKESTTGKAYAAFELGYTLDGTAKKQFVMSFEKAVYGILREAQVGDIFNITTKQNGKYTNWVSAEKVGSEPVDASPAKAGRTTASKASYETTEERAARQVMIVRQSSLGHAVNLLGANEGAFTAADAIVVAKIFEKYVMGVNIDTSDMVDDSHEVQ